MEGLLSANEANAAAFFGSLGIAPGVEVDGRSGRRRVATGIGHSTFNDVYSIHLPAEEADAYLGEALEYFPAKGLPWRWWVWPGTEPADLGDRLTGRQFVLRDTVPAMSVDLLALIDAPGPEGLVVERVEDKAPLVVAADLAGGTFGLVSASGMWPSSLLSASPRGLLSNRTWARSAASRGGLAKLRGRSGCGHLHRRHDAGAPRPGLRQGPHPGRPPGRARPRLPLRHPAVDRGGPAGVRESWVPRQRGSPAVRSASGPLSPEAPAALTSPAYPTSIRRLSGPPDSPRGW